MVYDWREKKHEFRLEHEHTHSSSKYNIYAMAVICQMLAFLCCHSSWHSAAYMRACVRLSAPVLFRFSCLVHFHAQFFPCHSGCPLTAHRSLIPSLNRSSSSFRTQFHFAMLAFIIAFTYTRHILCEWARTSFIINKMLVVGCFFFGRLYLFSI